MSRADPDQTNPSRVRWPPVWTADLWNWSGSSMSS